MHRAIALLCLLPALVDVQIDRADPRICLAPRVALAILVAAPPQSRASRPPARICLPTRWPHRPGWLG